MKFNSSAIHGLLSNERDVVGETIRSIPPDEEVVLAQGFGVHDAGVPLRHLGYIIPAIHVAKQLPESSRIEFYVALTGTLEANPDQNEDQVRQNAARIARNIDAYVARFHPDLYPRTRVMFDKEIDPESPSELLVDRLIAATRDACLENPHIANFVENRGGERAFRYTVKHALYMRDPIDIEGDIWLVPAMEQKMDHVIMVGGNAEKIFHVAREIIASTVGTHSKWQSHQFFTHIGKNPTYYMRGNEPPWQDLESLPNDAQECLHLYRQVELRNASRKDLLRDAVILFMDASGTESFGDSTEIVRRIYAEDDLPRSEAEMLQNGWDRLRALGT